MYIGLLFAIILFVVSWLLLTIFFTKKDHKDKDKTIKYVNKDMVDNNKVARNNLFMETEEMSFSIESNDFIDSDSESTFEYTKEIF